jgi:2-(1,2-epoxy-1,2-dihydrophenyl)acetyl-CoA isomerase
MASVTLEVDDAGVGHVTWCQPERGNPFDPAFCAELSAAATECREDDRVRAVLVRAEGRFFSVGGDLGSLGSSKEGLHRFITSATVGLHSAVSRFARGDAPVVCAVHAMCAGGGVSFAAASDFVLAAQSAQFYAAYQGIGLAIDGGGSYFMPRRVGSRAATSFYLRNERWSAQEALEKGLVSEVVPDDELADRALALATELAAGPTRSFGEVKELLLSSWDTPLDAQLEQEARAMARTVRTDDTWEAIRAVAEKRKPEFRGA